MRRSVERKAPATETDRGKLDVKDLANMHNQTKIATDFQIPAGAQKKITPILVRQQISY